MRIVKWFLGSLLGLAVLLGLGSLFLSSNFSVSRSVEVQAPPDKVYALVVSPRQWKHWSVWNQRDPAMKIDYSGPESGVGAVWAWTSASEGDGKMSFTAADPGRRVGYDLYFPDFGTTSTGAFSFEPSGQGTRVTWLMNGNMGSNPLYRWIALFADGMVGKDFEAGLANLKKRAEQG